MEIGNGNWGMVIGNDMRNHRFSMDWEKGVKIAQLF
jgi:hypothetical protein